MLSCARERGVDSDALVHATGIDPRAVDDRDARIPTAAYLRLFELAVRQTADDSFGPRVGQAIDGAAFGLLGFVVASSPTLREALDRFARYSRLLCDELSVSVVDRGDESEIVYAMNESPYVPALFEMAMVHMVGTARRGTRGAFVPTRLCFRHQATPREIPTLTHAPAMFGEQEDAVVCKRELFDLPLRGYNATLLSILEARAAEVLERLPNETDLLARTRQITRALLPEGEPSLEAVAEQLGLGGRTLQRRLRGAGVTFRALVDEVRHDCALAQLKDPDVSVAEVAFSLGFSDPSAFSHAFRRWTGRTPGQRTG